MPNVAKVLKEEIERISQRTARSSAAKLRKELAGMRAAMVKLRRELAEVRSKTAAATASPATTTGATAAEEPVGKGRAGITSRGVLSLRKRLGLSQSALARLAGVTGQAVALWEQKKGKLNLRRTTAAALAEIQGMGKQEAQSRLQAAAGAEKTPAAKAVSTMRKSPGTTVAAKKAATRPAGKKVVKAPSARRGRKTVGKAATKTRRAAKKG